MENFVDKNTEKITEEVVFKNYKNTIHIFIDIRLRSFTTFWNVIMLVWRNRPVLSEKTSDSSAFLKVVCLLKYVLNCEQHFPYIEPD
jgi:hypothetical protein